MRTILKTSRIIMFAATFIISLTCGGFAQQTMLFTESFETGAGTTPPAGWVIEQVAGTQPGIDFVTGSVSPTITAAYHGAKFARYNSAGISSGATRLKRTTPVSTMNKSFIMVDFAWYEDPGFPDSTDKVDVQWSTDGTTWTTAGTINRYNAVPGWKRKYIVLGSATANLPALYVAFLFTSAHGNNCAMDLVHVTGGPPPPPAMVTIGTGTSTCGWPYYTFYWSSRTQMLYTAAELTAGGAVAGPLQSVGFNIETRSSQSMNNFAVKMGQTTATSLPGWVAGLPAYYSGTYTVPGTGWRDITLASPMIWDGTSNVIVEVCFANSSFTTNSTVYATAATGLNRHYHQENNTGCAQATISTSYTTPRPNIRFGIPPVCPGGALMGYVKDVNTGQTIDGAIVTVGTLRDTTASNGFYIIYNIPPGTVNVNTYVSGYISYSIPASIACDSITSLNIQVSPGPQVGGIITDASTGNPIIGATIKIAGTMFAMSVAGGSYLTPVIPIIGVQTLEIAKTGYDSWTSVVNLVPNSTFVQDAALLPAALQPGTVTATLNDPPSTAVSLSWEAPQGAYELIYDDGIQDGFAVWDSANNLRAVRFTPQGWPARLTGGKVNLGAWTPFPITSFKMMVYKADGPGGTPGTVVDSVSVTPASSGWISFVFAVPKTIQSGDFYLAMKQGGIPPHAAGIGIDTTAGQSRSYSRDVSAGGSWIAEPGNYMIRAILLGTGGPLLSDNPERSTDPLLPDPTETWHPASSGNLQPGSGTSTGDQPLAISYQVWRLRQGQENNPAQWISIWTTSMTTVVDNAWPSLYDGPYRWAVKAVYSPPGQRFSAPSFSNVLGKNWTAVIDVCVGLSCEASPKAGTAVRLTNVAYPDTSYVGITDTSGCVHFVNVWKGDYIIQVQKFSYPTYSQNIIILGNATMQITLPILAYPPLNFGVNSQSLQASWQFPTTTSFQFQENWATGSFTTNQWTLTGGANWQVSTGIGNPAPSAMFNWTPADTNYNQYLTSKSIAGVNAPIMQLRYDIYLSNASTTNLNTMAVELFDGTSWTVLKSYTNAFGSIPWTSESLNITSQTANQAFRIRFHAAGTNSNDINNWNIDNIGVYSTNGSYGQNSCITGYNFYLNESLIGFTPDTSFVIPPELMVYGQTYTACVRSLYGAILSTPVCQTFTSSFLYPPRNLNASYVPETVNLTWDAPLPSAAPGLTGYNVYRNGIKLNPSPVTILTFSDGSVPFGLNSYRVTALYGAAESLPAGPVVVNAVPLLRSLNDIVVANGMVKCYNAVQTISVAGNGTTFIVENGGSATMIAGQQIICYPGTIVQNGGYLLGYIAPAGPWCTTPSMPAAVMAEDEIAGNTIHSAFKVYPNPTTGNFIIEVNGEPADEKVSVNIYGMRGEKVFAKILQGDRRYEISISDRPVGIYFIRLISGNRAETVKIIKQHQQ